MKLRQIGADQTLDLDSNRILFVFVLQDGFDLGCRNVAELGFCLRELEQRMFAHLGGRPLLVQAEFCEFQPFAETFRREFLRRFIAAQGLELLKLLFVRDIGWRPAYFSPVNETRSTMNDERAVRHQRGHVVHGGDAAQCDQRRGECRGAGRIDAELGVAAARGFLHIVAEVR